MIAEYTLPPPNVNLEKQENDRDEREWSTVGDNSPLGHLEIEVSRIRLVKSIRANSTSTSSGEITAKIIWWGEQRDKAGTVSIISCDRAARKLAQKKRSNRQQRHQPQQQLQQQQHPKEEAIKGKGKEEQEKLWLRENKNKRPKRGKKKQQQQHPPVNTNTNTFTDTNKLRYSVRSKSLAVFLDYLRQCPAIEIVVAARCDVRSSSSHAYSLQESQPPPPKPDPDPGPALAHGHTLLPLPTSLLRKYAANYGSGCNFEHKTKIYALYRHLEIGGPLEQVQQQQQLKVGHIQLRFKMLFAEPPPLPPPQGHASGAHGHAHAHALAHAHAHAHAHAEAVPTPPGGEQVMPLPTALLQDQQPGELLAGEFNKQ
ncbi:hypothetical protein KR054_007054 [Drosophila jambulina]|nr:hypothetical protein KR054_007054 [Drosophila jambulina]